MNFCFYSKYNGKSTIEQLRRVTFFVSSSSFHIVYYYEMSGQMKTLIDRLNPMYSKDYKFRDVYLLATAAEEGDEVFEKVITGLNGWIDCFEKTSIKGTVLCGGVSDSGAISGNDKLKEAYDLGSHV